jgi:hypothetical protein
MTTRYRAIGVDWGAKAALTDNEHLAARFAAQLNHMIAARPHDWWKL